MDERALLDFMELRLSSPGSSRCELHISAEGQTEKLACGFLRTFLSHVRAAQELYATGLAPTLRLEGPEVFHGSRRPWFTKKTLERFVQYISAPEVLERVKTIEDELVQLEQVRSIQADSLPQVTDGFMSRNPTVLRAGLLLPEYHDGNCHFNDADNSKRELLRAMDVRLSALRQEQSMAFCRATAAGFDADSIEDLLAFSDFFGADHLRVACNWFWELYTKQQRAAENPTWHRSQELVSDASKEEAGVPSQPSCTDLAYATRGPRMSVADEPSLSECTSPVLEMPDDLAAVSPARYHSHSSKGLHQRSSPRRRSASPLKKVQMGRFGSRRSGSVVVRSINYLSDRQSKERNHLMETSSSDSEDNVKSCNQNEAGSTKRSSPAAARRLSVQAAINLFESKQGREGSELPEKQRSVKQQSRRGSLDGTYSSISGKADLNHEEEMNCEADNAEWQESTVAQDCGIMSDSCRPMVDSMMRSPGKRTESTEVELEVSMCYQGGSLQSWKQTSIPKKALNFRMGSSTSEHFVALELDSMGGSPTAGQRLEPADSENSNVRSTITSISQSEAFSEKNSFSVDSRLCSTPTRLSPPASVAVSEQHYSQGLRSQKLDQAPLLRERGSVTVEGGNNDSRDCMASADLSLQALASLAERSSDSHGTSGGNEGRFYEHYRKLRDAKRMEEQESKRAEREAKLRLMEETLDLRKAEMDAQTAQLIKENSHAKSRAAKLLALKANLTDIPRGQEDKVLAESKIKSLSMKDSSRSDSSPPSPPLTPRVVKEQVLTPKYKPKKAVAAPQKNSTTPRSSTRAISVSPKTTRGTAVRASSQRTPASSASDNSLACSVQCFSDLKKENSKPSPGKPPGAAHVLSKNSGALSHLPVTSRASLLESNGSMPLQNSSSNRSTRVDRKNRMRQTRQSFVTSEFRDVSPTPEDEVSIVLTTQKDAKMEAPVMSKIRRSAVAPIQEVRPFLRKGSGIGPGAGPGVMKLKAEAIKSSDEDAPGTPLKISDEEVPAAARNITDTSDGESMPWIGAEDSTFLFSHTDEDKTVENEVPAILDADVTHHSDGGFFALCGEAKVNESSRDDELLENERACHTISFPIDFSTHKRYAANFTSAPDSITQEPHEEGVRKEGESSATLSQLLSDTASQLVQSESSVNGSESFRANLATEEHNASRFSPLKAASLASSSLKRLGAAIPDYFSPSTATLVESPVGSPASWNSSHVQYASETDFTRQQKKVLSSQKPVVVIVPPKEPARGFKRLLKFGRKSRAAPEIIITDGVSASTPSEGDDDTEDIKKDINIRSAHDVLRKVKLQERLLKDCGISSANGSHGYSSDTGSMQSLQSSIPIPPSNFKLKYDHATGSSKLKAPRSFFSLSTFRSRGSEGKSR